MDNQDKKQILLVDDDPSLLLTLGDFLKFEGYAVTTANSGENGLKVIERMTPDLIILDMSMPGMGGIGFLKEISTEGGKPKHPVLVLTARANMAEFFANVDVDGFVAKPCDPSDLLMEVARIIFLRSGNAEDGTAEPVRERKKVIVGEDDDLIRERLVNALAEGGFIVDAVSKGPEVLEQAIVQRPHLIVMKLIFAGMNGDAVANMLKAMPNTSEIPVILYDDSDPSISPAKYVTGKNGVKRFLKTSEAEVICRNAGEVAGA
jgi:two-component system, NtrC family, sensor kinase